MKKILFFFFLSLFAVSQKGIRDERGNVVLGSGNNWKGYENSIKGADNQVIGNRNQIKGSANYVKGNNNYVGEISPEDYAKL